MEEKSSPSEVWSGDFGESWTERQPTTIDELDKLYIDKYGLSRTELNKLFLNDIEKDARILEVGANTGIQLEALGKLGFKNLYGVEILRHAVEEARQQRPQFPIFQAEAGSLPFEDNAFDLVFTSGVLIHIPEDDMVETLQEIARCADQYIWGFEYFAKNRTEITYRGQDGLLWKDNFASAYESNSPFKIKKEIRLPYLDEQVEDTMFLLDK